MKRTTTRKTTLTLVTKYGLDSSALSRLTTFVPYIPSRDVYKSVLAYSLAARSSVEARFLKIGTGLVESETGKLVLFSGYEWLAFKIPGGSYKPDWCFLLDTGEWACIEIKASKLTRNYRDSRSRLRAAAALNPWFLFYEAMPSKGSGWALERIEADPEFLSTFLQVVREYEDGEISKI